MTRIEDMSETQRQSWITLIADGAVFIWFWQKMTAGLSPQVWRNYPRRYHCHHHYACHH